MGIEHHYATVSEAINELTNEGYNTDLNLEVNCLIRHSEKFIHDKFAIEKIYRFEGDSDPADESTVYGIRSTSGMKGIFVTGYGISTDSISEAILDKLTTVK